MAESSNYSRSVLCGSDADYSRSVLGGSDVDYSRTIFSGSDELMENPCEPCQNDGKNTTAVKFCAECSEYLCGPCCKNHVNFKAFRHHVIKDMEAVKPVVNEDSTKIIDKSIDKLAQVDITFENVQQRPRNVTPSSGAVRNVTANLLSRIDTSTSNDIKTPNIYDLTVVLTHYCVVADTENKSVKVFDTRTWCVTSQIQLNDVKYGWCITSVNDDQVAVAVLNINGGNKLLFFSISPSGIISDTRKSVDVGLAYHGKAHINVYHGIAYTNGWFYAATYSTILVYVISMQGQIITTFTNKSFSGLRGIALSNDHNTLYVCSWGNHRVFRVDLNGNVTASYTDNDLKRPQGITVDSDGYVYVCSDGTRCVHQLTADLSNVKVIIKDVNVWSCAFNKNDNNLILGYGHTVKVYTRKKDID